ncbi:MAG TPA: trehalose-phosphatase [Gemmataceae bacterium]|jgi:trehalose 6-phosphate phosphatase|nr:trehalose-phosphatase [Gemmataceae bacterium]
MSAPLFDVLPELADRIQAAPYLLLGCDFDGALAPVFDHPQAVTLSSEVRGPLVDLANSGRCAILIVSGRSAADLRARADVPGLIVAGNHGLELVGPDWEYVEPAVAESSQAIANLAAGLRQPLSELPGVVVEEKGLSVTVHFRHAPAEQLEAVRSATHGVLSNTSHPFVLTTGRMCFDIRPRVYWNKGEAIRFLLGRFERLDALVIFIGGDPTDEDAFAALPDGITIRVGAGAETAAKYHVDGPDGVRKFLEWLRDQLTPGTK